MLFIFPYESSAYLYFKSTFFPILHVILYLFENYIPFFWWPIYAIFKAVILKQKIGRK